LTTPEHERLQEQRSGSVDWQRWGTYLSERAWGTVREDYSADGDAWNYFPFEQARSRAYRWNEDGLAGWCDAEQTICMGVALWNGQDSILKERPFGLTNGQGNHGEDVKDYWFYTDNLPTHAYASMTYKYPQAAFPYEDLIDVNAQRTQAEGEYELFDALRQDWLANRYWDVTVEYAKATPEDVVCRISIVNRGPEQAKLWVIPQLWYRNTWTWEPAEGQRPRITRISDGLAHTAHPLIGDRWYAVTSTALAHPPLLFCENETNNRLLFDSTNASATTKDGIDDYLVRGHLDAVNRHEGSKMAALIDATVDPGESFTVTVRFGTASLELPFDDSDAVLASRRAEADAFYAHLAPSGLGADERLVQRQALAGLLWCKQFYHYGVRRWLRGDPGMPTPPQERWHGRNSDWQHFAFAHVILMPDAWEYPWFAAWDLAFHCATMALIDPEFAKKQVLILLTSTTQHPHGQIPAYEWSFGDTNPPVHAWATWQVYQLDKRHNGVGDHDFLASAYRSITLEVMWWLNRRDADDRGVFGGGFLGMDNIGVFDRDQPLPTGGTLDEVDGTAWMAALTLQMLEITAELAAHDASYRSMIGRWLWDAWLIATALEAGSDRVQFWNEETGFYHDVIEYPDGRTVSLEVFSMQSVVPLFAGISIPRDAERALQNISAEIGRLRTIYGIAPNESMNTAAPLRLTGGDGSHSMVAIVGHYRLGRILERLLDPEQFLSPYGLRSLSKAHERDPFTLQVGDQRVLVRYLPAESDSRMFGGNSNWRGPIWMPMNFLFIQALNSYARFFGDTFTVANPADPSAQATLDVIGEQMAKRLIGIFARDGSGRRAVFGDNDYFQTDPHWRDLIPFYEYFDGDTGSGLGASHQTGWTACVALLLQFGGCLRFDDLST